MNKKEIIIIEVLNEFISHKNSKSITQYSLSKTLGVSLSTVNNAIKPLINLGAIDAKRNGIYVIDFKKALLYLASTRNLKKDIIYQTFVPENAKEIEKNLPHNSIYAAFSAYKFLYNDIPADYSEVYIYADEDCLKEIKKRFPEKKGPPNLFVLSNKFIKNSKDNIVQPIQIYIDLWNLREWYAKEFLLVLEKKLKMEN